MLFYKRGAIENVHAHGDKQGLAVGVLKGEVLSDYERCWLQGKRGYYYSDIERAFILLDKGRLSLLLTNKAAFESVNLPLGVKQHIAMDLLPEQVTRDVHFAISNAAYNKALHTKIIEFVEAYSYAKK